MFTEESPAMSVLSKDIIPQEVVPKHSSIQAVKTPERDRIVTVGNPNTRVIFVAGKNGKKPAKPRTQAHQQHLEERRLRRKPRRPRRISCVVDPGSSEAEDGDEGSSTTNKSSSEPRSSTTSEGPPSDV